MSTVLVVPALREQVRVPSQLVGDLFELARIDAGALTPELRQLRSRPSSRTAFAASRPRRGSDTCGSQARSMKG